MFHIVAWQRALAFQNPVMESNSLMPTYSNVDISADTHLDPATCELVE